MDLSEVSATKQGGVWELEHRATGVVVWSEVFEDALETLIKGVCQIRRNEDAAMAAWFHERMAKRP